MKNEQSFNNVTVVEVVDWVKKYIRTEKHFLGWKSLDKKKYFLIKEFDIAPPNDDTNSWKLSIELFVKSDEKNEYIILSEVTERNNGVALILEYPEAVTDFAGKLLLDTVAKFETPQPFKGGREETQDAHLAKKQEGFPDVGVELSINTNVKRFEEWLDRYRLGTLPFIIELEEDRSLSITGAPTFQNEYRGLRRHAIKARISTISPNEPDVAVLSFPFIVIEIDVEEPAENRLFIKAQCKHPAMTQFFSELLDVIARQWPEAETAIRELFPKDNRENKEEIITLLETNREVSEGDNREDTLESLFENLSIEELSRLENDITGGKELLYYLAQDLLKDPPDTLAIEVARNILSEETMIDIGEMDIGLLQEWASNLLDSIPNIDKARRESKVFVQGANVIPEKYLRLLNKLKELPVYDAEELLLSYPWIKSMREDFKSASIQYLQSNNSDIQSYPNTKTQTEEDILIEQACIEWAGRWNRLSGRQNMSEFLLDFYNRTEIYLTEDLFKKALKDAGRRGLIVKVNRRWRLPRTNT